MEKAPRQIVAFSLVISVIACGVDSAKPKPREPRPLEARRNIEASTRAESVESIHSEVASPSAQVVSAFVEGWDLRLASVTGATIIFDPHLLGIGRVENDRLEMLGTSAILRGLGLRLLAVAGHWPERLWALTKFDGKRHVLYRYEGSDWKNTAVLDFSGYREVRLFSGKAGSTWLILVGADPDDGYQLIRLPKRDQSMPEIRWNSRDVLRARFALPMNASDLVVTSSGELFGFGEIVDASTKDPGFGIGSWRGSEQHSGSGLLPLRKIDGFRFSKWCGGLDVTAYLLGHRRSEGDSYNYLAKWDGEALSAPLQFANSDVNRTVESCTVSPDGALWLGLSKPNQRWLVKFGMHQRATRWVLPELSPLLVWPRFEKAGGKWRSVNEPLPSGELQGYTVTQLRVLDGDEVWGLAVRTLGGKPAETPGLPHEGLHRTVIFRSSASNSTKTIAWADIAADATYFMPSVDEAPVRTAVPPAVPPAVLPPSDLPKRSIPPGALKVPKPNAELTVATATCQPLFVAIYELTPEVPKSFDFVDVRSVIRNRKEFGQWIFVEAEQSGRRFFGALIAEFASGERLVRYLEGAMKGVEPQLLCGRMSVIRSVPMVEPGSEKPRPK